MAKQTKKKAVRGRTPRRRTSPRVARTESAAPFKAPAARPEGTKRTSLSRWILPAALLFVVSGIAGSFIGIQVKSRPTFALKTEYNFGSTVQGRIFDKSFSFENIGTKALVIKELRASDGSVNAIVGSGNPPVSIPPGGSSELKVTLHTVGKVGPLDDAVTVVTNDPRQPERIVDVKANVTLPVGAASHPEFRELKEIVKGDCVSCHVTPGVGKKGKELYEAACAVCHGMQGEGRVAPPLNQAGVTMRDENSLTDTISKGTGNMPGYLQGTAESGPYDKVQIASLVKFIKAWQKNFQSPPPMGHPGMMPPMHAPNAPAPKPINQAIIN